MVQILGLGGVWGSYWENALVEAATIKSAGHQKWVLHARVPSWHALAERCAVVRVVGSVTGVHPGWQVWKALAGEILSEPWEQTATATQTAG